MDFGNLVGQLLQGVTDQSSSRLEHVTSSNVLGNLMDVAQDFLSKKQAGEMTGGQLGSLGALAGALLGGGGEAAKGAIGGSAMAILGALAASALQKRESMQSTQPPSLPQDHVEALTAPETEQLIIRAMIGAAKADGQIDQKELDKIFGRINADHLTDKERQFLMEELSRPTDLQALVAAVPNQAVAAQVYAASLFAIDIDTEAERIYLQQLAEVLKLDLETVNHLHELTGLNKPA
ncbi:hypothetical conserved protein [Candidatus Nitrosoglobus terrae]|uniref:Hypothetical conserved protein n=1 Tax=Candidatus Nitrosoglobus terrae TaxID=1630141 RepID=A0A1Q2SKA2_9GAMM|nr:tellurite resistance TerB family protein [Candidatus Nitrosoglobus terrae]BAW79554.1 hypothetical conserved protein [Candidatus Nitrosoglobus terrae]